MKDQRIFTGATPPPEFIMDSTHVASTGFASNDALIAAINVFSKATRDYATAKTAASDALAFRAAVIEHYINGESFTAQSASWADRNVPITPESAAAAALALAWNFVVETDGRASAAGIAVKAAADAVAEAYVVVEEVVAQSIGVAAEAEAKADAARIASHMANAAAAAASASASTTLDAHAKALALANVAKTKEDAILAKDAADLAGAVAQGWAIAATSKKAVAAVSSEALDMAMAKFEACCDRQVTRKDGVRVHIV